MAHPLIPFVTEEIYSYLPGAQGLLAARVGTPDPGSRDERAEAVLSDAIAAVQAVRAWRDSAEVKPSAVLPARLAAPGYEELQGQLARLTRLELDGADGAEPVAAVPVPRGAVEILASADVDLGAAERKRGAKRAELSQEIERAERKLGNQGFVEKAPAHVVQAERDKLASLQAELEAL